VGKEEVIVEKIVTDEKDCEIFNDEVTKEQIKICQSCLACTDDCSTAMTISEYHPEEILELVHNGKIDEAIGRKDIWYCMNCHECIQKCPQNFGMVKLIVRLKNLASAAGIRPGVVEHRLKELQDTGFSFAPNKEVRDELGLFECSRPKIDEFKKLIEEVTAGKSND
jgi:heterodisulfide reductase subunit C